ncbi:AAA family ATPase [Streptomyces mirabilis]
MLIVMAGLPAAGKSSVAEGLGRALPAVVVPVAPVEAAMWRAGVDRAQPTGLAAYLVAEAVADGVLALGQSAVIDAVNAVEAARRQWRAGRPPPGVSGVHRGSPARARFDRGPGLERDEGPGVSGRGSTALTARAALGTTCPQPYSIEEPEPVVGGEPPGVVHQIPVRQIGVGP